MSVETTLVGIISFIVIFAFCYFDGLRKLKKPNKKNGILEIKFLTSSYNIPKEKLSNKAFITLISFINAVIMVIIFITIECLNLKIMYKMMLGFVLCIGLIYSIYGILGKILEKRYK